ncbi:hypothetical protein GW17_00058085 [Ensete ventricosum]|nr:hypothetical protein GW17_00058085 [Ensete ventricosum]
MRFLSLFLLLRRVLERFLWFPMGSRTFSSALEVPLASSLRFLILDGFLAVFFAKDVTPGSFARLGSLRNVAGTDPNLHPVVQSTHIFSFAKVRCDFVCLPYLLLGVDLVLDSVLGLLGSNRRNAFVFMWKASRETHIYWQIGIGEDAITQAHPRILDKHRRLQSQQFLSKMLTSGLAFRGMANPLRKRHHEDKQAKKNA